MSDSKTSNGDRIRKDMMVLAGLLFAFGLCAAFNPLANIVTLTGHGTNVTSGVPLSSLIGGCLQAMMGLGGMLVGYMSLVHNYNNRILTGCLILWTQFAWWPFITDLTDVGKGARTEPEEEAFIPLAYNPTTTDVRFVGAMGILGILAYGISFLGSLGFMEFSLFAYQSGKSEDRGGSYYRGRLTMYAFLPFLGGLSQLMLGSYIISNISSGPLDQGAIAVAMYIVSYPEISVTVGLIQMLVGIFALGRRFGKFGGQDENDHKLQKAVAFMYLCTYSMQILTQIAYQPGGAFAGNAPSIACLSLGFHVMPAFLDFKMRNTPEDMGEVSSSVKEVDEGEEEKAKDDDENLGDDAKVDDVDLEVGKEETD